MDSVGIYRITSPSGKSYVGMTMDSFENRWKEHLKKLRRGTHPCVGLLRAFTKYGEPNLRFEILESIPIVHSESFVLQREQEWWDRLVDTRIQMYNGRPTGTGSVFHTNETKAKISKTFQEKRERRFKEIGPLIIEMYENKVAISEIAKSVGMTRFHVQDFISLNNLNRPHTLQSEMRLLSESKLRSLHNRFTTTELAHMFDLKPFSVQRILKNKGIELNDRRK